MVIVCFSLWIDWDNKGDVGGGFKMTDSQRYGLWGAEVFVWENVDVCDVSGVTVLVLFIKLIWSNMKI